MKKIYKVIALLIVPVISFCAFLSGCRNKKVEINNSEIMQDMDVAPTQTPAYKQYSGQAMQEYRQVAANHTDGEDVDIANPEVVAAAKTAAAKLFAYACYNERTLDKYVYFSHQDGDTDLGASGSANATRQEYYLRVNEGEDTCGYRWHYTIKKVNESSGLIGGFKSLFESARIRVTDQTNLLYRFEGSDIDYAEEENANLGVKLLTSEWKTGKDWGKPDVEMKKSEFISPENIKQDIEENAGNDNITIRANINILADNIIKDAIITEDEDGFINLMMVIDTEVANKDQASLKMIRKGNGSDDCVWQSADGDDTGFMIFCRLWSNGLFRFYSVVERWSGKMQGFPGTVESQTLYSYSYSDRDCDMTKNLETLEQAKKEKK